MKNVVMGSGSLCAAIIGEPRRLAPQAAASVWASPEIDVGAALRARAASSATVSIWYCARGAMAGYVAFASSALAEPIAQSWKASPYASGLNIGRLFGQVETFGNGSRLCAFQY